MPRSRDESLKSRLLLGAGTEAFAELGFAATTMAEVGRRAGVTKGGVYFHFPSKEALGFAVLDAWRERLQAAFRPEVAGTNGERAAAQLEAAVARWLGFHFEHPAGARVLRVLPDELRGRWTAKLRQDARADLRARRASVRAALVRGVADGSLFSPDPVFAAFVLVSSMDGVVDHWLRAPADTESFCDADRLAAQVIAPWRTSAGPAPSAPAERSLESPAERALESTVEPGAPGWQPFE